MTVSTQALLQVLHPALTALTADLAARAQDPGVQAALHAEWQAEVDARRTADPLSVWTDERVHQIAAAWLLSVLFVRTLEDRKLCPPRLKHAKDARDAFRALFPYLSDRDYLRAIFRGLSHHPSVRDVFDATHNPVWVLGPSAAGATALFEVAADPEHGLAAFDLSGDTRFLGDVYERLNEHVRKRYALLQTPDFVEDYLLHHTLDPALASRGTHVTVCDPTCGSGHLLLGAFRRLLAARRTEAPHQPVDVHAYAAIHQVYGVDLNPYAVAIARFRLVLAYLDALGATSLQHGRDLRLNLAVADSLLPPEGDAQGQLGATATGTQLALWRVNAHALRQDDEAVRVFAKPFDVVVGNPPYITPKDEALREEYRKRYTSAHGKYQLVVPFVERFFQLTSSGGWVGAIVGNGFMKREFGKKLIEGFLPTVDLTAVVDTSGAYIPGHGTPTVILFGRHQSATPAPVRCVMGKRGEPTTPDDPANGLVWSSIRDHGEELGYDDDFLSVDAVDREKLGQHPWSLRGGGASDVVEVLERNATQRLGVLADSIGVCAISGTDEVHIPGSTFVRLSRTIQHRHFVSGEQVRDWNLESSPNCLFPYEASLDPKLDHEGHVALWPWKRVLASYVSFGKLKAERGMEWFEYGMVMKDKLRTPLSITFAFVATHNHFVLDRGGKVFKQSAPIIKLPADATEDDHLALLGYLNSSTACFWMKQVAFDKGGQGINQGFKSSNWRRDYEFDSTKLKMLPIPAGLNALTSLARRLDHVANVRTNDSAAAVLNALPPSVDGNAVRAAFQERQRRDATRMFEMVFLQEEVDWTVYSLVGLGNTASGGVAPVDHRLLPTDRAVEVALSAKARAGAAEGLDWYNIHGWTPRESSEPLPDLTATRLGLIARSKDLTLLEAPEYKRRWYKPDYAAEESAALRTFLLTTLESTLRHHTAPASLHTLAHFLATDPKVLAVAQVLTGHDDPDLTTLLTELALTDAVPYLSALTFTATGLKKHNEWQRTWAAQRREDAGEAVTVPLPPKYGSGDYLRPDYWRLRGKLDVPKERFVHYPGAESEDDPSPVIGWAGWDHAARMHALHELHRSLRGGADPDTLTPLLAGLFELLPWVQQWHGDQDPHGIGIGLGTMWRDRLERLRHDAGLTEAQLAAWRPTASRRPKRRTST